MSLKETLSRTPGEIVDLAAYEAIDHGAKQKREVKSIDEFLKLR
jgi:hypothetical protein|nr:MAG TPA: hypothetical protein [Caudoviricetes sp.]